MSSAAAITNVNARFAFVLLIGFLLNHIMKDSQHNVDYVVNITKELPHNVDYVVWRNLVPSRLLWIFENCIKKWIFIFYKYSRIRKN